MTNHMKGTEGKAAGHFVKQKKYKKPERCIVGVDYHRIEEAPLGKFEKLVQKRIAAEQSPLDCLIEREKEGIMESVLQESIKGGDLSICEKRCIELQMEGLRPSQIARRLRLHENTVRTYLERAVSKLKIYFDARKDQYKTIKSEIGL